MDKKLEKTLARLKVEQAELQEKLKKLNTFLTTEAYKKLFHLEQEDLLLQKDIMDAYNIVLLRRISRMSVEKKLTC